MTIDNRTAREKIAAGQYDVTEAERQALSYEEEEALWRARYAEFKADALREVGLAGHPKADRAFALAEDWAGKERMNVVGLLEEIAQLLLED